MSKAGSPGDANRAGEGDRTSGPKGSRTQTAHPARDRPMRQPKRGEIMKKIVADIASALTPNPPPT